MKYICIHAHLMINKRNPSAEFFSTKTGNKCLGRAVDLPGKIKIKSSDDQELTNSMSIMALS